MRSVVASGRGAASSVAVAVALSLPSFVHAGTGVWTTGGPYGTGDAVVALAIDAAHPATLYAGTDGGGVFRSTDAGGRWAAANTGLTELHVVSLAIDPVTPTTVYAGTSNAGVGVFKSIDAGLTWTAAGTGLPHARVNALVIDPSAPSTLYAGLGGYNGGVFKSTDGGATWAGAGPTHVLALVIDPTTPATLYAGTWYGVVKSTDAGSTWTATAGPDSVISLAIDPVTPGTLYAGTWADGIFKTTDSGATWAGASTGLTDRTIQVLAVDPSTPTRLYAGTWGGVFKSTNSGATWTTANTGLTSAAVYALAIDPSTPTTLYAGAAGDGIFKSTDAATTWAVANAGLANLDIKALAVDPTSPSRVYAGGWGFFRSFDSGSTWTRAGTGSIGAVGALAIDPRTPTRLYAATDYGDDRGLVLKSTDSGATWVSASTGLPSTPGVLALAIDSTTPTTLYAGTNGDGVFKSTNGGTTWSPANTGLTYALAYALAIHPTTPATLYAGTAEGVFKSVNAGGTWVAVTTGLTSLYVRALAIDPTTPTTLYAGTDGGVFKSVNAGSSWTAANTGLTSLWVRALAIDPATPTTLYAGTDGGVFKSTDSGGTWTAVNKGLGSLLVNALTVDPTGSGTVYAGLWDGGAWQATPPTGGVLEFDLTVDLSDSPDPVTGTTPLTYTLGVANAGPDYAICVSASLTLPGDVIFDSAGGSGWTCSRSAGVVTCGRSGLAVGAAPPIAVRVTPGPVAAVLLSSATVLGAGADPNSANNSDTEATTVASPPVWIGTRTKTVLADSGEFVINGDATYTITLTNIGSATQADNPGHELVDLLPSSLILVSASAASGVVTSDVPTNTVAWDGSLPSGGSATVTIHAQIGPTVALGTSIANQATVSYDFDGDGTNEATTLTDDPSQPGASDPTSFVVVSPATDFYTLTPCRLIDTRSAAGTYGGPALVAGSGRVFPLWGRCHIPPSARALSVNLTVTQSTANGSLRLYPAGTPVPGVSAINYVAGKTRANNAIAPLNGLGELAVYCSQAPGTAHLVLDVNGYFGEGEP